MGKVGITIKNKERKTEEKKNNSLDEFVGNLNAQAEKDHVEPVFYLIRDGGTDLLLSVEVRFSAAAYHWLRPQESWETLLYYVRTKSHRTMFPATSLELLENGILEMKVASRSHNFREEYIAKTIEWLAEFFFPKSTKRNKG